MKYAVQSFVMNENGFYYREKPKFNFFSHSQSTRVLMANSNNVMRWLKISTQEKQCWLSALIHLRQSTVRAKNHLGQSAKSYLGTIFAFPVFEATAGNRRKMVSVLQVFLKYELIDWDPEFQTAGRKPKVNFDFVGLWG